MPKGYFRFPTIHEDQVVFVCEDDLWTVPAGGGLARRLTSNLGEVSRPLLSPDGSQLAFVGREEGHAEVYVMPAQGGPAQRLTYMGGSICVTSGWTSQGKILFANNARHWYLRFTYLYEVDLAGNPPQQFNYGSVRAICFGPNGGVVLGRNTDDPATWKRYRGGRAGQLWIDENGTGDFHPLIQLEGNLTSPMWLAIGGDSGRIFFVSDHEGIGNLYSCLPAGDDLQRHTDHQDYYARNATTDGRRIVYHAGGELFIYDPLAEHNQKIEIEFHSPQVQRNRKFIDASRYLQDWVLHPKGEFVALTARGKLFTMGNWEGAVLGRGDPDVGSNSGEPITGVRYRLPEWLNDGKRMIAISDEGGEEKFVIFQSDDNLQILDGLDIGRPDALAVSPRKDQIVFSNHRHELFFLDLDSREMRLIDRGRTYSINGFDWSPDGEWLVYSISETIQTSLLKLWNVSTGETTRLTEPVLRDVRPSFDPAGKYIYFLSYRVFDPIYDNIQFDLGFPMGMKPYLITLQKDLSSPFIPKPKTGEEAEDEKESQENGRADEGVRKTDEQEVADTRAEGVQEPELIQIDLAGIERRIIAFPVPEGRYGRILGAKDGKVFYSRFPIEGVLGEPVFDSTPRAKGILYTYDFEEQKEEVYVKGINDFSISRDGSTLIYQAYRRLRAIKVKDKPGNGDDEPTRKTGWIDLGRVKVSVLPGSEWRQMFREAWRLQRDQFWTPDMSQVDWIDVHDRYLPLVDRISSRSEFSDLMWEMQGELGTSHAYEFGGDYRPEPRYQQGYLGADFEYDEQSGGWRVTYIYQGDAWEILSNSPLGNPGVKIQVGDILLSINGRRLSRHLSPDKALVNLADEEVSLVVLSATQGANDEKSLANDPCEVTVITLTSETSLRYREWVEKNRRLVHQATDDRVGYVHIPDMAAAGYAEFHRAYLAEVDREGLIVDVRFNRGGHVSALLLEKLARRRIGYDTARWSEIPNPYPPESVLGPIVALTNEYAGSDGDIFSHGFKLMKLGPLIGKRTWGGVVGIWPRHSLVDGTLTTQPEFSFWFYDVGWGVENYGTDPDIEVDIKPQDYARGVDTQLERGIQEVLALLESNPPELPDFSQKPSKAMPRLPER